MIRPTVFYEIVCDVCDDWVRVPSSAGIPRARRAAHARGWVSTLDGSGHRGDLCPRCRSNARTKGKAAAAARARKRTANRAAEERAQAAHAAAARLAACEVESRGL
jgi:hypothetical protein